METEEITRVTGLKKASLHNISSQTHSVNAVSCNLVIRAKSRGFAGNRRGLAHHYIRANNSNKPNNAGPELSDIIPPQDLALVRSMLDGLLGEGGLFQRTGG